MGPSHPKEDPEEASPGRIRAEGTSRGRWVPMGTYRVGVVTGEVPGAGTKNSVSISLVGERGESPRTTHRLWFLAGQTKTLRVSCDRDLGSLLLVRLHKSHLFLEDSWFCREVTVTSPDGTVTRFPCHQWLEGVTTLELREGSGKRLMDEELEILREQRRRELEERRENFQWKTFAEGWPRCLDVDSIRELDSIIGSSCIRATDFTGELIFQGANHLLRGFLLRRRSWSSLEEMRSIFSRKEGRDVVPEYVAQHWRDDDFFGHQFLNGNNPAVIRRCPSLPPNFPVTSELVAPVLGGDTSLELELAQGRIFLVDYKVLEKVPAGTIWGKPQHVAAPLCLLHLGGDGCLRPIAIQLSQHPGPGSPIFTPEDPPWDWLLAKTWVRNADFYGHQLLTHLLRTHLLGEVFTLATLRHLPSCHPLFKLLVPHFHFTLHINTLARCVLINRGGVIDKASGLSYEGLLLVVARGLEEVTYTSLCLPDDIAHRGVSHLPHYHYRDDGLRLWAAIESFVAGVVAFYYKEEEEVGGDPELQGWVGEIFTNGFLGRTSSGVPSSLQTKAELTKFLTMVIFTCSAQHAAVNNGQYDLGAFLPNSPSSMRLPPPTSKGKVFLQDFLDTLPDVATTANIIVVLILLSSRLKDSRPLGQYPEERFTEEEPQRLIRTFQAELEEIQNLIEERNHWVQLRYSYLNPPEIENSISI